MSKLYLFRIQMRSKCGVKGKKSGFSPKCGVKKRACGKLRKLLKSGVFQVVVLPFNWVYQRLVPEYPVLMDSISPRFARAVFARSIVDFL